MSQFLRTEKLLGGAGLRRLHEACVMVAGLGAVGSYAVEALARAGVGRLILIDFDEVNLTNINRQLYALHSTIGRRKAELARARVLDINPACVVEAHTTFINSQSVDGVVALAPDVLIDAIDSLTPKVDLLCAAYARGIKIFSSMGAALRRDPGKIVLGDIDTTEHCPLAKHVRKRLRRKGIRGGIECVYSTEFSPAVKEVTMPEDSTPYTGKGRKRVALGSLSTITGIFGLTLANAAINYLAEGKKLHPPADNADNPRG